MWAGELIPVTYALPSGPPVTRRLCVHCAIHEDTPAMNCVQCFPNSVADCEVDCRSDRAEDSDAE